MGETGILIYDE